jgi:hypothetical protein
LVWLAISSITSTTLPISWLRVLRPLTTSTRAFIASPDSRTWVSRSFNVFRPASPSERVFWDSSETFPVVLTISRIPESSSSTAVERASEDFCWPWTVFSRRTSLVMSLKMVMNPTVRFDAGSRTASVVERSDTPPISIT